MSAFCSICQHPDRAEIDSKLASGVPVLQVSRQHALEGRRSSLYRHARGGHATGVALSPKTPPAVIGGNPEPVGETILKATRLAKAAERHMRKALRSDDLKAANGALASATKAFELFGKATGQLQSGNQVNVTVTQDARIALDAQTAAQALEPRDVTDLAASWLSAQVEAGDAHACAVVLELVRTLPSADASDAAPSS